MATRETVWEQDYSVVPGMPGAVWLRVPQSLLVRDQRREGKVDNRLQGSLEVVNRKKTFFFCKESGPAFNFFFSIVIYVATKLASTLIKVTVNVRLETVAFTCTRYLTEPERTLVLLRVSCDVVVSDKMRKRYIYIYIFLLAIWKNNSFLIME